jgi:membrane protein DedA with SNARE-associated domain
VELAPAGLLAIIGLILVKEAGVPVPVPGDLIVIGAGVAASQGRLEPVTGLAAIVVASIAGGIVQYALIRSVARPTLLRILGRVAAADRLDRETERLRRGGARSVALARSTPGIRIVAIAASALAAVPAAAFVLGLVVGNALFISAHFGLGFVLGEPIVRVVGSALGPIAIVGIVLAIAGAVGWWALARRRRAIAGGPGDTDGAAGTDTAATPLAAVTAWADACCLACLSLAALEARR